MQFTNQRPVNLIYLPHVLANAVLTLDTGSPTVLRGWDAATTSSRQKIVQILDEYTFGVHRDKWRKIFPYERFVRIAGVGVFSLNRPSRK